MGRGCKISKKIFSNLLFFILNFNGGSEEGSRGQGEVERMKWKEEEEEEGRRRKRRRRHK